MTDRGHHNGITVAGWIEGAPEKRWWGFSLKGKARPNDGWWLGGMSSGDARRASLIQAVCG